MFRLVCICAIMAVASAQGQRTPKAARYVDDPRDAAILSEQRYQSGDGTFGAAYTQEDGVDFKEESDAAGNRKGSYSYVDPSGQRRTISYTAGKNGFVATGDHLPVAPAGPAAAPQPQAQAAPRYNPAPQQQYSSGPRTNPNEDDGQYYPELYENTQDTQSRQQYSAPQPQYQAAQPQYQAAPQPQYQAAPQQQYSGVQTQAKYIAPKAQSYQPEPQYNPAPVQQQYNPAPAQPQYSGVQSSRAAAPAPRPQQYFAPEEQTQSPHRFFPPGKLDLNRSPDGYSYSFSSKY